MAPTAPQPVLVYDRIAQNHRKTILLVIVAVLAIVPFVAGISYAAAVYTLARFGHHTISPVEEQRIQQAVNSHSPGQFRDEEDAAIEREIQADLAKLHQQRIDNDRMRWQITLVFAVAILGILGLLFWSLASSPVSTVLQMCGARPSGAAEVEAKRLLENLAIGAGLPTPKLYVIDSPVPNAFAAGMDPARSVIAVTQGLLALLDHRELEGVLAHEISHIGNRDTRLNTVVTAIALFLRLPYLLRQQHKNDRRASNTEWNPLRNRYRFAWMIAMLPVYVYVFFIAPMVAAIIRAAISRSREFLADADAALLTRNPEGLLCALAKVRGAGSSGSASNTLIAHLYFSDPSKASGLMGIFRGNMLATHPTIEQRINRLMEFNGGVPMSVLETAVKVGVDFGRDHPALKAAGTADTMRQDELSVFTAGNPMGRVFRVLSDTCVYDQPDLKSGVLARVSAGSLLVVFDDPGKFRQVLTHNSTFGYMPMGVKLQRVDMMPAEIHDPDARAAAQTSHEAAIEAAKTAAASHTGSLTPNQIAIAAAFAVVVFAGLFFALMKFGGS